MPWIFMVLAVGAISGLALFWSGGNEGENAAIAAKTDRTVSIAKSFDRKKNPADAQPIAAQAEAALPSQAAVDAALGKEETQPESPRAETTESESAKAMALAMLGGATPRGSEEPAPQAEPAAAPAAPEQVVAEAVPVAPAAVPVAPSAMPSAEPAPQAEPAAAPVEPRQEIAQAAPAATAVVPSTEPAPQAQPAVARSEPVAPQNVAVQGSLGDARPIAPRVVEQPDEPRVWLVVTGSRVNVRDAPDVAAGKVGSYTNGTKLERIEKNGIWVRVQHPDTSESGWMHGDYLAEVAPTSAVRADRLKVRSAPEKAPVESARTQTAAIAPTALPRPDTPESTGTPLKDTNETARRMYALLLETEPYAAKAQAMSGRYLARYDNRKPGDTWTKKRVMGFSVPVRVNQSQARALILKEMGDNRELKALQDKLKRKNIAISKLYAQLRKDLKPEDRERFDALDKKARALNGSFRRSRDKLVGFGAKIREEYGCCQYPPASTLKRLHRLAATMRARRKAAIEEAGEFPKALKALLEGRSTMEASLQQ